jgi:hypothetical protein
MNAVEIEQAVTDLVEAPFDAAAFPFEFLAAFGNKDTTIKRLKSGEANKTDLRSGPWPAVLQHKNIHIKVCGEGEVAGTLTALRQSPATAKQKAQFILATDGKELQAERLEDDVPPLACEFAKLPDHFGFFLPLAGISTVRQIAENAFDIRATGRLNRLYVELLKTNPDWDTAARREELNHFFARLIFCFFAEDTAIFDLPPMWTGNPAYGLFTATVEQMTERDGSNTHEVLAKLFEAMNTPLTKRAESTLPGSALRFPYVNGNLFSGSVECPKFSKSARSYLLFVGGLDWKKINPDIFGSMIQAVADDEERGALGMHYTSVPNILKVLNPLFLDDLRQKLAEAGDGSTPASKGQLKRLRDRLARIRVFDPACGSGNFLVIAYKEMRQIEAEINMRRGEPETPSVIPMTNFRGIELRHFAAEIARLALIIAKFQCDALHIGDLFARRQMLPLHKDNWITCGNSLRLDWLQICPPTGTGVKVAGDDLFNTPLQQAEIDFENAGGETYLCGNPPYSGSVQQSDDQKRDMAAVFADRLKAYKDLDYVAAFILRAAEYNRAVGSRSAMVATNSVCQGEQVAMLWPLIFSQSNTISFAHQSFLWRNLASNNAGVTCIVLGLSPQQSLTKRLFNGEQERVVASISPYLTANDSLIVRKSTQNLSGLPGMVKGNQPNDGGRLILDDRERALLLAESPAASEFVRLFVGARDYIQGTPRWCLWISDGREKDAMRTRFIAERVAAVREFRGTSKGAQSRQHVDTPHRFVYAPHRDTPALVMPRVFSSNREFMTVGYLSGRDEIISDTATAMYDATLWAFALVSSRVHLTWIQTVCGRLKTDCRYSNTLGWNTFPVPPLTDQNKADLTRCAEEILLAREAHFPATIADLYDPEAMPADLRAAHDRNDETLERIYIGRKFKNDTERLEVLFKLYTEMTAKPLPPAAAAKGTTTRKKGKTT